MIGVIKTENRLADPYFRWRSHEVSRLEALSDAVFAFAVTLLVVSLEVPKAFTELIDVIRGFPAFAICFVLLIMIWHEHTQFFRRYGLQTALCSTLNAALLFLVLFYVYPLKFLFTVILGQLTRGATLPHENPGAMINDTQVPALMVIYGLGFAFVYLIFVLLHWHALRLQKELELNDVERYITRAEITDSSSMVLIGLTSAILAATLPVEMAGLAGWIYMLIGPVRGIMGSIHGKTVRKMFERVEIEVSAANSR